MLNFFGRILKFCNSAKSLGSFDPFLPGLKIDSVTAMYGPCLKENLLSCYWLHAHRNNAVICAIKETFTSVVKRFSFKYALSK